MFTLFSLTSIEMSEHLERLRAEVRAFLRAEIEAGSYTREPSGWDRYDAAFSRRVAACGWIGMTWPRQYGGHERTSLQLASPLMPDCLMTLLHLVFSARM